MSSKTDSIGSGTPKTIFGRRKSGVPFGSRFSLSKKFLG